MTAEKTCADCGAERQTGAFCDLCGAVLAWGRTATVTVERMDTPNTSDVSDVSDATEEVVPAVDAGQSAAFPEPLGAEALERARPLVFPVEEATGDPDNPRALPVLPGRPVPARPQVRAAVVERYMGGVLCPWCDTPNPRERHFCRVCAASLAGVGMARRRRTAWWRRLLLMDRRGREAPFAGQRPRLRRGIGRIGGIVVAAVLGATAVGIVSVEAGPVSKGIEDHFAKRVEVVPGGMTASHSDPAHGPGQAVDGYNNTYWGDGYSGSGSGVYLEASFSQPEHLLDVIVTPGISVQPDQFGSEARPQVLLATFVHADGHGSQKTFDLDDTPGPQKFAADEGDTVKVRLTIESTYGASAAREVAIAEVEFFARSRSGTSPG